MASPDQAGGYLEGHLIVAMPSMGDERFARSVIYMCAHNAEGAMGLVINKLLSTLTFPDLLKQLNIDAESDLDDKHVHFGGPVETGRGFVLHSADVVRDGTLVVDDAVALTATVDILQEIAGGRGPRHVLLALGYAGWGPGQLEAEIQDNAWLHVEPDAELLFDGALDTKWQRAVAKLGINFASFSGVAGRA